MDSEQLEILVDSYPVKTRCAMSDSKNLLATSMHRQAKEISRAQKRLHKLSIFPTATNDGDHDHNDDELLDTSAQLIEEEQSSAV